MTSLEQPSRLLEETKGLSTRTSLARAGLGSNVVVHGVGVLLAFHQMILFRNGADAVSSADVQANLDRFGALEVASWISLFLGAITFLPWLHGTYRVALRVAGRPLELTPSGAVASFFLPIVSFYRPYQALRDLDAKIDPSEIPEPPIRPATGDVASGYRDAAIETHPAPAASPRAPVLAWWLAWLGAAVVSIGSMLVSDSLSFTLWTSVGYRAVEVCGATLAILMVSRIQARLVERARRAALQPEASA